MNYNWYNKIASFDVNVISVNSYGVLILEINFKPYNQHIIYPYSAIDIANDINNAKKSKAKGRKLNKLIRWLDKYIEKQMENTENGTENAKPRTESNTTNTN